MMMDLVAKHLEHDWDAKKLDEIGEPLAVCITFGPIKAVIKDIDGKQVIQVLTHPRMIFDLPEIPEDSIAEGEGTFSAQVVREVMHSMVEKAACMHSDEEVPVRVALLPPGYDEESDTPE